MPKNKENLDKNNNTRSIVGDIANVSDDDRSIELSFSSEVIVKRWYGNEILSHDEGSVDLTRLNEIGVLLFNHNSNNVLGKVERAWLDTTLRKCKAIVKFDNDDESEKIFQKVKNGTLRGVSVGYSVDCWEEVRNGSTSSNGRFTGPAEIATKWSPTEISIVSVPADPNVGVGRSLGDNESESSTENNDDDEQTEDENESTENDESKRSNDPKNITRNEENNMDKEAILQAERKRTSEINTLSRKFNMDLTRFIDDGTSVEDVRSYVLNELGNKNTPIIEGIQVTADESDKFRSAASDSILLRAGIENKDMAEGANSLRGLRLRDLAIESLRLEGKDATRWDDQKLFRTALTPGSNFSSILDNTVNKSLLDAYNSQVSTYKAWTTPGSVPDFKDVSRYRLSEAGNLELITENGEFKHDEMKDEGIKTSLLTYGKKFSISRQALINDDISILTKLPQAYVRAADRGINKLVYKMLCENGKIYDGVELFHNKHNNLAKSDGPIRVETLAQARKSMRTQKNLRGDEVLNISPKYLIVPAALETHAEQFLNSLSDADTTNSNIINPFRNKLKLIVDPELDTYSETAWYVVANPNDCGTIEVSYLNGKDTPTLESAVSFENLGMNFRIYMDYGVNILDFRGLYKNNGQ